MKRICSFLIALVLALTVTGCGLDTDKKSDKVSIVTTMFAAYDFAREIAGDRADITLLLKPGADSHSYEPSPKDMAAIDNCDIFIYTGGENDDWVDRIAASSSNKDMKIIKMLDLVDTKGFLKSVLDKEVGLRTGKPLSHVCVFDVEGVDKLLFLTDVAFIPYPTLEDKVNIISNTVEICNACGIDNPKVAPLAAVEVVNPKMPATVDAAELVKMNEEGKITGCIVDGPLSMDLAICPEAAEHKGCTDRKIVGDADILLFPDIHAGNICYKAMVHTAKVINGNMITGTKAPVILTSRSDSFEVKVNSLALGAVVAEAMKNK